MNALVLVLASFFAASAPTSEPGRYVVCVDGTHDCRGFIADDLGDALQTAHANGMRGTLYARTEQDWRIGK